MNMSILVPFIAPPQSLATNTLLKYGIYTFVPYGITFGSTAIVPHFGFCPVDVVECPEYAEAFDLYDFPVDVNLPFSLK